MPSHIRVAPEDGRTIVQVDDEELFDFVDDFLTEECGLDYDFVSTSTDGTRTIHFPDETSRDAVTAALERLDPREVERIFRINNPVKES